ncbi:MAG: hypothetical protein IJ552_02600 [Prevotella sp.]|nr:hypothetical protein [Prevotella sp.]
MVVAGAVEAQTTYKYYALHATGKGYMKQRYAAVANDGTFRSENVYDANGYSIWVFSSEGYLTNDMYYLCEANGTLILSDKPSTKWELVTDGDRQRLQKEGTTQIVGLNSGGTPVLDEPTNLANKYAVCEMTVEENNSKWEGPKDVSYTVRSPQLVTFMRVYYIHNITATILKDDANKTNQKVVDKKDSRIFQRLKFKSTTDSNRGTSWDIDETNAVIYNKQASGDVTVKATYTLTSCDPIAANNHPAVDVDVTLKIQPAALTPDPAKNYLLFYTKEANYRFPYATNEMNEGDAVNPQGKKDVLADPDIAPNNQISWKVEVDAEGFVSFKNIETNRYVYYDASDFTLGSNYGVVKIGDTSLPSGDNRYKFRIYQPADHGSYGVCQTIIPYDLQFVVGRSDGDNGIINDGICCAWYVNKDQNIISLGKGNVDSKWKIYAYEAENRLKSDWTLNGPNTASETGTYNFTATTYYSRNIVGSPANNRDLEIVKTYTQLPVKYKWTVTGINSYITTTDNSSNGDGKLAVAVNSMPVSNTIGAVKCEAYVDAGTYTLKVDGVTREFSVSKKLSNNKTVTFNLYPLSIVPTSFTEISSLSQITDAAGYYKLTADCSDNVSDAITVFTGWLDGDNHTISGLSAPLFAKMSGAAVVRNLMLQNVNISSSGKVGAIASEADGNARIYNVGILSGSVGSSDDYCGGIVGLIDGSARVINCFSYANITGGTYVGGIVGYNNYATTSVNAMTMVMNCMFYGDITDGDNKAPIYNGKIITNRGDQNGVGNYNYFWGGASYVQNRDIQTYNCALMAETRFLQRFEFFRHLLNSHRELAAWWATGSTANKDQMMKWVLLPSQIGTSTPYPILKKPGYYPSVVNIDAENAPTTTERNKGGKLGSLTVNIQMGSGGAQFAAPAGAEITTSSLPLNITDKDPEHFNFNYAKVQLPYYNDVGTKNYTGNRVVTGWKIVSITGGTEGSFSTGTDATTDEDGNIITPYNFADRKCTAKDLYSETNKRVFNQGAYWDVPEGVTAITIEPYWAKAAYLADPNMDKVYNSNMGTAYDVPNIGGGVIYTNNAKRIIAGDEQTVYTSLGNAVNGLSITNSYTVNDYAVVLVGNYHHYVTNNGAVSGDNPYTVTSIDLDGDDEPDYSLMLRDDGRNPWHPVKWDFLNIPGLGMAQKSDGGTGSYNFGIMRPKGWFEATNTSLFRVTQFEYDYGSRTAAPLILQGGVMEQWVSSQNSEPSKKTTYFHVGGNVWFKEFHIGGHQDNQYQSKHPPISVTGGDFDEFYLTGLYRADVTSYDDNAECYINGGRFGVVAGTGMEGIGDKSKGTGNIVWQIQNADIREFYGGGINATAGHIVEGSITTTITGGKIDQFCGGPKFGDMNEGTTVVTTATGCEFGTFFGAGYGGNSYSRRAPSNYSTNLVNMTNPTWNGWVTAQYTLSSETGFPGISTQFSYQFIPLSGNTTNVARLYVEHVTFSLATTHDVTSTLTDCTITGNFYGGGSLGKVAGPVTSTLTNCKVSRNVYGAGYSASLPTVEVDSIGFRVEPYYYTELGTYRAGVKGPTTTYTWKQGNAIGIDKNNHILYTTENLSKTNLGSVSGAVTLTITGSETRIGGSVYGGGEESGVDGNTEVTVTGGTIGTPNLGGAEYGNVFGGGKGKVGDKVAGYVKGNTAVNISQAENMTTTILHNIYGGGAYGSVGDFTYDATSGMPTTLATENTGVCNIAITGGTIGTNGKENGMIFGSSRGDVATPEGEPAVDPNDRMAWVYSTNVTIGTPSETPSLTTPKIAGSIYGSGENGHTFQNTEVTIHSGTIGIAEGETITDNNGTPDDTSDDKTYSGAAYPYRGNVYGGGCGTDMYWIDANGNDEKDAGEKHYNPIAGIVRGNATVTIDGGHVVRNVYGAGAMGSVGNETEAESASTSGKTIVTIKGKAKIGVDGDDNGNVYGAARGDLNVQEENYANVRETELEINGNADIKGSAFGGGEAGIVWESVAVNMKGGSVANDVYGGGALAKTQIAYTIPANAEKIFTTNVNLTGGTIGHNVYGGGLGRMADETKGVTAVEAKVYGKVLVALNEPKTTTTGEGESAVTTTTYGDCEVKKNIFGCNNLNGSPQDEVTVHIYKTVSKDESGNVKDKPEKNSDTYEVKAVYGGGNLAAYEPKATDASANVIIDGCGLTSIETVYGGGNAASTPATNVTVNGTYEIEEVFGGGNGKDAITINGVTKANPGANVGYKDYSAYETSDDADNGAVTKELRINNYAYGSGAANVNIYGGTIHRVFGGSNTKGNVRISAVTMLEEVGCEFCVDEAYGGGKSAPMDAEAKLLMACIPGLKEAYGGAKNAEIDGDVTLTITNGTFNRVFGGNDQAGYIKGTITVNIEETGCKPVIIGELYGGGNLAPYTAPAGKHGPTLNVRSFSSIGDIYGGGLGSEAEVTGDTYVNINVCEGRWKDGTYKYATAPSEVGVNDKITELNAKGYHAPSFTSGIGVIHTVFGGGNAAPVIGNTNVFIGTKSEEMFLTPTKKKVQTAGSDTPEDDSDDTYEEQDTTDAERTHTVKGASIVGNVYGGGNNAEVTGNTNVVIGKEVVEESVTPTTDPTTDEP